MAVTLGAVGVVGLVSADSSDPSSFVAITPERIMDTRDAEGNIGLPGPFVSGVGQKLQVTGSVPTKNGTKVVVPAGATGVSLNVTVVLPVTGGFISVRPGTSSGVPLTSNLNFGPGAVTPNAVNVALPVTGAAAGTIDVFYQGQTASSTTEIIIDVVGYYVSASAGPAGPAGPAGAAGPPGPAGAAGSDAPTPANVVIVSTSGGDFTGVQAALDSITDASATNPYLIRIGPGVYEGKVVMKPFVDIEGSGTGITTLTSNGGAVVNGLGNATVSFDPGDQSTPAEIRDLTIVSDRLATGEAVGLEVANDQNSAFRGRHLEIRADGVDAARAVQFLDARSSFADSTANAVAAGPGSEAVGIYAAGSETGPIVDTVTVEARNAASNSAISVAFTVDVELRNVDAFATGSDSVGLRVEFGSPVTVNDSRIEGALDAVRVADPSSAVINDSLLTGRVAVVPTSGAPATGQLLIGGSAVDGSPSGNVTCRTSHTPTLDPLGADCTTGSAPATYWARIGNDGAIIDSNGFVTAASDGSSSGLYVVEFSEPIIDCLWTATRSEEAAGTAIAGEISVERQSSGINDALIVRLFDSSGALAAPSSSDGFAILVTCN